MPADKGAPFPIAALGIAALLVSTVFVGQRAFDMLRLGETDTHREQLAQPPVDAQLWEDPFAALARHRAKYLCPPLGADDAARQSTSANTSSPPPVGTQAPATGMAPSQGTILEVAETKPPQGAMCADNRPEAFGKEKGHPGTLDLTVIAAIIPGANFVGAEEARRRTRFAVLAGLAAEHFAADNPDRIGFFYEPLKDGLGHCRSCSAGIEVVYETFTSETDRNRQVVLLWINDVDISKKWLSGVSTIVANELVRDVPGGDGLQAKIRILGPQYSGQLVKAFTEDAGMVASAPPDVDSYLLPKMKVAIAQTTIVSPWSTTPAEDVLRAAKADAQTAKLPKDCAGARKLAGAPDDSDCINALFSVLAGRLSENGAPSQSKPGSEPFFVRTVQPDNHLTELLELELSSRLVSGRAAYKGNDHRVVLLREWDSLYARDFAEAVRDRLKCGLADPKSIQVYSYLRGIDGAGLDGAPKQLRLVPRAQSGKDDDKSKQPDIEWPESRDQRDYVRRLVNQIRKEADAARESVVAVGIFGLDVHDKLIVAQALREALPDALFFTTDLDATLLHPEVLPYTQNMIVASSYPLVPPDFPQPRQADDKGEVFDGDRPSVTPLLQLAPFRDSYQTATFLAARYAVSQDSQTIRTWLEQLPKAHIFEIGRHGEVELAAADTSVRDGVAKQEAPARWNYFVISSVVLALFAWLILFGQPGPAMQAAFAKGPAVSSRSFDLSTAVLCALTVGALGFAAGVLIELNWPGTIGLQGALRLAAVAAAIFAAVVYPGVGRRPVGKGPECDRARMFWAIRFAMHSAVALAALACVVQWLRFPPITADWPEPFAPDSGVSAWPSQLLRTLALVLLPWFVDRAWNHSLQSAGAVGLEFFGILPPVRPPWRWQVGGLYGWLRGQFSSLAKAPGSFIQSGLGSALHAVMNASLWFWRPKGVWNPSRTDSAKGRPVNGHDLWQASLDLLRDGVRFWRLLFWIAVTGLVVWAAMTILGQDWPGTPVRGAEERALFGLTKSLTIVGAMVLLILVTNSAVLTYRVILIMQQGRTIYPFDVVQRFARELGPRIAASPSLYYPTATSSEERAPESNSLFDPWLDVRLMARHTHALAPMIFYPCLILSLLIVARSRLFDNWGSGFVIIVLGCYLLWAVAMAVVLNMGAEKARRKALQDMEMDLLWLKGAGDKYKELAEQFPALIQQVRDLSDGAFAPFFEQPLVRAILVPLGSAGGVQLLETFMFASR
ncbi:MAG: hypothetical protein JO339_31420 [Alphaproteobacteria bacterium]|nr:hypothetical protein [Alphaproteobacteria bacterium]